MLGKRHHTARAVLTFGDAVAAGRALWTACDADHFWRQAQGNQVCRRGCVVSADRRRIERTGRRTSQLPCARRSPSFVGSKDQPTGCARRTAITLALQRSGLVDQITGAGKATATQDRGVLAGRRRGRRAVNSEHAPGDKTQRQSKSFTASRICVSSRHLVPLGLSVLLPSDRSSAERSCCACIM